MNRQTLADVLQDTNQTGSYTLATVLEGAEAGSQLLLRDGDALWQTPSAGLLQRQLAALQDCTATGFLTLDGQRVFAERAAAGCLRRRSCGCCPCKTGKASRPAGACHR